MNLHSSSLWGGCCVGNGIIDGGGGADGVGEVCDGDGVGVTDFIKSNFLAGKSLHLYKFSAQKIPNTTKKTLGFKSQTKEFFWDRCPRF